MLRPVIMVIGRGRVGLALSARLVACGAGPVLLRGRGSEPADGYGRLPAGTVADSWSTPATAELPARIVVAVPDGAITTVAEQLASRPLRPATVVLHTSGLEPAEVLAACRERGAEVASWHPLQTFPSPSPDPEPVRWEDVACAIEGDDRAVRAGFAIARRLGLRPWRIDPARKAEYHAAAAVGGNLVHVLVAAAVTIMDRCGAPDDASGGHLLRPLVEASVAAAFSAPDLARLTGPIARRDHAAISRHREVLGTELRAVYDALATLVGRSHTSTWLD